MKTLISKEFIPQTKEMSILLKKNQLPRFYNYTKQNLN